MKPLPPQLLAARALSLLALAASFAHAGVPRYARIGELEGNPEVQVHAADDWRPALRNLPLIEASRIRGAARDRIEIECDDNSYLRLTGDAEAELSDYTQLSTGQRITLISLDRGVAYFTGEPRPHDTLSLAVPGAQITLREGSRVRLEAYEPFSAIAVIEGVVRFTTSQVEMDLHPGQFVKVDSGSSARFTLLREIPQMASDAWSEGRDMATAQSSSAAYVANAGYGLTDLDHAGAWIQTEKYGVVWKPQIADDWHPFREGHWEWYDGAGFTWIAAEPWGWLPYHYGRWIQDADLAWVWSPDGRAQPVYKPGDVYWMRGANRLAWGPLASGEVWAGTGRPLLYAPYNTTLATFAPGQRLIDPSSFDSKLAAKPAEALAGMMFTLAPLSPPLASSRFDVERPALRTASDNAPLVSSAAPQVSADTFEPIADAPAPPPTPEPAVAAVQPPPPADYGDLQFPAETYYPAPVYTGIVVIDPPLLSQRASTGSATTASVEPEPPKGSSEVTHERPPERVPVPPPVPPVKSGDGDKDKGSK